MKRILITCLALILILTSVSACSGNSGSTGTSSDTSVERPSRKQDTEAAETKAAQTAATAYAETKEADNGVSGETKEAPAETEPAQTEPAETKPAETKPAEPEPSEDGLTKEQYESMTVEDLIEAADIADPENLTVDEFCRIVGTLRFIDIDYEEMSMSYNNITMDAINEVRAGMPELKDYLGILLASPYPQVRAYAYSSISSLFGTEESSREAVMKALDSEEDEYCLMSAVEGLSNDMAKDPAIAEFIFRMSEHENSVIRRKAAVSIGSSWSKGVDGTVERIIEMMHDEDVDVRKAACQYAGNLGDEAVIEPLVEILNDPEQEKVHGDAVRGLSKMWLDYPFHAETCEAAYRATMDYYSRTPRTDTVPSWAGISSFNTISEKNIEGWYALATYFDADEFFSVMASYIEDPDANWLGKSPAMKAILALCPEKFGDLEDVMSRVDDSKVIDSYEKLKAEVEGE